MQKRAQSASQALQITLWSCPLRKTNPTYIIAQQQEMPFSYETAPTHPAAQKTRAVCKYHRKINCSGCSPHHFTMQCAHHCNLQRSTYAVGRGQVFQLCRSSFQKGKKKKKICDIYYQAIMQLDHFSLNQCKKKNLRTGRRLLQKLHAMSLLLENKLTCLLAILPRM